MMKSNLIEYCNDPEPEMAEPTGVQQYSLVLTSARMSEQNHFYFLKVMLKRSFCLGKYL